MHSNHDGVKRGDVYYIRFDDGPDYGLGAGRPAVVVSSQMGLDVNKGTVMVIYLTTNINRTGSHYVRITTTQRISLAKCNEIYTIDRDKLDRYVCSLNEFELKNVDSQLKFCLGLSKDDSVEDFVDKVCETENHDDNYSEEDTTSEIESLRIESEMWKRLYEKTMNLLVENQFNFKLNSMLQSDDKPKRKVKEPVVEESPGPKRKSTGKVNVNEATVEEIMEGTGMGEMTAKYIVRYRKKHGPFAKVKDLMNVSRFGKGCMDRYGKMFTV